MTSWEMQIEEIFKFTDGRTVFVGKVRGQSGFIPPGECELWIGEKLHSKLRIEGEMIAVRSKRSDLRSVSTHKSLDLEAGLPRRVQCKLMCTTP